MTAMGPAKSGVDRERVLIVEDDAATRVGLAELVRAWGYETDEAASGEDALRTLTGFRPSIVIQQAEDALKGRNFVFAVKVADKAETLARRLGGWRGFRPPTLKIGQSQEQADSRQYLASALRNGHNI
jgi:CheY-like chemotaxis protein